MTATDRPNEEPARTDPSEAEPGPKVISSSDPASKHLVLGAAQAGAQPQAPEAPQASKDILVFLISMAISFAVYWNRDGWEYAAILILVILVHEMGHFVHMKKSGLEPRPPIFIPYVGAFVQPTQMSNDPVVNAWSSFAGPFAGGMAAVACYHFGVMYDNHTLILAGNFGFFLNLLQLVPIRPFDGGFIAETVSKWLMIPGVIMVGWLAMTSQSMIFQLVAVLSVFQVVKRFRAAEAAALVVKPADRLAITVAYIGWIALLSYLYFVSSKIL